ncbi:MAG: hypothetical protein LBG59_06480 [Candidatus Peribacteria bacterium]|jgi:hypothetical protein|nr:hypothetical protein [Candidatus Peribacteria bacterium]
MTVETFHTYDKSDTTTSTPEAYLSPDQKLKHEIEEAKEETSAKKIDWIGSQRGIITPEQLGGALNENALEEQASILLKNPNHGLLNTYITREAIPAIQNKQRKTLPHDVFECFRLAIQLNT